MMRFRIARDPYYVLISTAGYFEVHDITGEQRVHFGFLSELGIDWDPETEEMEPDSFDDIAEHVDAFLEDCAGHFEMTTEAQECLDSLQECLAELAEFQGRLKAAGL